jgi:hypothetical protein
LQFVDHQHDGAAALARGFARGDHQIGQIGIEIAAVGQARFRFEIERDLNVVIFDLELGKTSQRPQRPRYARRRAG